jgi:uncharacterized protein YggE
MLKNVFFALGTVVVLAIVVTFLPLDRINWGRFSVLPAATITVTGSATGDVSNQKASFGATVMVTNADKQTAVDSVNSKMTALIDVVKNFGIASEDIKTQSVSVYQIPATPVPVRGTTGSSGASTLIYPVPPVGNGGDWQASNSITITLRDVNKASGLADLLQSSGATSVWGPNFTTGDNTSADVDLLAKAVADAKSKAETIAKAGGQTIGRMINVQEGGSSPIYPLAMTKEASGTTTPTEPGTSTLSKSVTVVFELK